MLPCTVNSDNNYVCHECVNVPEVGVTTQKFCRHFKNVFSDRMVQYTEMPDWAVNYTPVTIQDTFDLTPITPGLVKKDPKEVF